jgi:mannose-6-phosphate isomerase-like protein (cupin superfamily)/DNA-binding XRE family transcriptional regulator
MSALAKNLRRYRKTAHLTQAQLADAAGLPRATVASLEQLDSNPGLHVVMAVADVLGVAIDDLVRPPPDHRYYKVEKTEHRLNRSADGSFLATMVSPIASRGVQIQRVRMEPDCKFVGQPHPNGSQEFFYVIEGTATLIINDDAVTIGTEELVQFPGNLPHTYRNLDPDTPVEALSVVALAL